MKHTQTLLSSARVPFLLLAPLPVLLGVCAAWYTGNDVSGWHIFLAVIAALAAHISVNAYNEYEDFTTGLDAQTQRTPFSGGSGGLIDNPAGARSVLLMGRITLLLCVLIGLYFVFLRGWSLLLLGLLGIGLILAYTPVLNGHPLLCWLSPGLGFGLVMVLGTELALAGEISKTGLILALVMTLIGNNLLLLNQLPDIEADRKIGRRHIPIVYGKKAALEFYFACVLAMGVAVIFAAISHYLPLSSLLALLPLSLGWLVFKKMQPQLDQAPSNWIPELGKNVAMTLLTPLVLGLTVLFAA
ncbi:prenyltransferase [Maribrevibacterium harenarium]|uniref:Prenyltransferase n=1 Tax=Maribrevibacterium harenarium TaxID=2589817 RepID=A0A501X025_9GAMM|nr:prenyltransferase [Maribrevibacterium harenarium]TPE54135.1 prenyltransferase [Maribrevibacterium harenarium]